jgi:hypothetical protein
MNEGLDDNTLWSGAPADDIDIEEVMRRIRQHLATKHGTPSPDSPTTSPVYGVFTPQVYEDLGQAEATHDKLYASPYLTPSRVAWFSAPMRFLRAPFHRLVVFYVNKTAESQVRFNGHVVRTLEGVVHDVDYQVSERLQQLEQQVSGLERQLKAQAAAASDSRDRR